VYIKIDTATRWNLDKLCHDFISSRGSINSRLVFNQDYSRMAGMIRIKCLQHLRQIRTSRRTLIVPIVRRFLWAVGGARSHFSQVTPSTPSLPMRSLNTIAPSRGMALFF
ncbi:MAG: hypothetical protein WCC42_30195, partial [Pseudolabrys sp.]